MKWFCQMSKKEQAEKYNRADQIKEMVLELDRLLIEAKAGNVKAMAYAIHHEDGAVSASIIRFAGQSLWPLATAITALQTRVSHFIQGVEK